MDNFFVKAHGLGNDYVVLDETSINFEINTHSIVKICDVHYGIGSDGILLKVPSKNADFALRILNPDGSEAEKSGNGLRIFAKYLYDYKFAKSKVFTIETLGGIVTAEIVEEKNKKAAIVKVDMGKAIFTSKDIPVICAEEECLDKKLVVDGKEFLVNCVSVGNPHCIVIKDDLNIDEIVKYGSLIENHPMFPNRINVQFAKVISATEVEIIIWERGAGYTLASGSSSSAVACMIVKKGLAGKNLSVKMPGGILKLQIADNWEIQMTGEVREIASGKLSDELTYDLQN